MNKKIVITGLTCAFLLISGVCYSCSFIKKNDVAIVETSLITASPTPDQSAENTATSTDVSSVTDVVTTGSLTGIPSEQNTSKDKENETIFVHICGAVAKPDVYQVEDGARIYDLIKLAGGLRKDAAGDYMNQAMKVSDGQRIYIPTVEEVADLSSAQFIQGDQTSGNELIQQENQSTDRPTSLVNINTAGAEELMSLPGIGQAKADSIIRYRTESGRFAKVEDLMNISGIKEGLFNKIASYITVE